MVEIGTRTAVPQFTYTILSKIKSDTKNHYHVTFLFLWKQQLVYFA